METSPVQAPASDAWAEQVVASLHAERDSVREFLTSRQTRLERAEATLEDAIARLEAAISEGAAAATGNAGGGDGEEDYRARYETALDDLRELKANNALLQEQLSKARATASRIARTAWPRVRWAAQSRNTAAASSRSTLSTAPTNTGTTASRWRRPR